MDCPYCGVGASLVDATVVYGKNTNYGKLYICRNYPQCDTYVGAHSRTLMPKGTLANRELRKYRGLAHRVFDKLWNTGKMHRQKAYGILAHEMGMTREQAHIGLFDVEQCKQVIQIFSNYQIQELPLPKKRERTSNTKVQEDAPRQLVQQVDRR